MDKLTPQLTEEQLKQNIDVLKKAGKQTPDIQSYVDNYKKDNSGSFILKSIEKPDTSLATAVKDTTAIGVNAVKKVATAGQELVGDINKRGKTVYQDAQDTANNIANSGSLGEKIANVGSLAGKTAGQIAGGVGDMFTRFFEAATSNVTPEQKKALLESKPVQDIATAFKKENLNPEVVKIFDAITKKADENPVVASAIKDAFNVVLNLTGGGVAENTIKTGAKTAAELSLDAGRAAVDTAKPVVTDIANAAKTAGKDLLNTNEALSTTAQGAIKNSGRQAEEKIASEVWDIVQPKLNSREQTLARKNGLIDETTLGTTKLVPDSGFDQELIDVSKGVVDPKATINENIKSVQTRVKELNQANKAFLRQNDGIFNPKELKKSLEAIKTSDEARHAIIFGSDKAMESAYDDMIAAFMKVMEKYPKKLSSVLDARQEFDRIAESVIPKAFDADARDTIKKIALRDIRMGANDFVAGRVKGGQAIKDTLRNETLLLEVADNISERAPKIGDTAYKRFSKRNPIKTAIGEKIGNTVGLGGLIGVVK